MRAASLAVLVLLAVVGAWLLIANAARAPDWDAGGNPGLQLVARIDSSGDILRSGTVMPLRVRVVDQYFQPVMGATVRMTTDGGTVSPAEATTDVNGFARFTFTAVVTDAVEFHVKADASLGTAIHGRAQFSVVAIPVVAERPILSRPETVSAGIGAAILAALVGGTEFGKYGLSNLVFFPLYSRMKKEEVLDHFVRGQIYGYIAAHPGEHYNSLKDALKVTNGTLAHHLRTLEIQGFIKADRDGIFKRFYPVEMQIPRDRGIRLSDLQHNILGLIRSDGGPTQQDIAGELRVSQQTVSYNLRHLSREGLVRMEKDGRAKRYFPMDT